ncbi:hypothetical protein E3Q22_04034 [Wallemia mellicola]|uniref:G-patch domain-containing protein n=1 Tax=Wallemia mellicola TaxID=1708541 RepID=A0A4T0LYW6_9BASI|nr:hypothetical protein E3Q22_04034 [Wallemia mellicola]
MSLYGGIFYEEKEEDKLETNKQNEKPEVKEPTPPPVAPPKPSQNWNASLKFAPIARKPKAAAVRPSIPSGFTNASISKPTNSRIESQPLSRDSSDNTSSNNYKAPSMTIDDDDVNGFKNTLIGKRTLTKKEKKMKKKGQLPPPGPSWDDDYDPYKPTDYSEYKQFAAYLKEERIARKAEELSRRQYSSSEYSDSDDDKADESDRGKNKMFAPPSVYDNDEPTVINKEETGDEVFQRRLAMSSASAQKARMDNSGNDTPVVIEVKEEEYKEVSQPPKPQLQEQQQPPPPAPTTIENLPNTTKESTPSQSQPTMEEKLKASQAAAASIAEKFSKLVPKKPTATQTPPQNIELPSVKNEVDDFLSTIEDSTVSKEEQDRGEHKAKFAERFMAMHGWKQGEGLGANKSGIKEALTLERSESGAGEIISKEEARLDREAKDLYGEPSKTIILRNMVSIDEVDNELSQEIAEECNKNGIVERVVIHTPREYNDPIDAVKILVKFSGLVGAYKNVRELNGRFFGGSQVKARYYPDNAFDRGNYDL